MVEKIGLRGRTISQQPIETVRLPFIPTVRVIIQDAQGRVLLLKKSSKSKAPNLWEFPGGTIDPQDRGTSFSESAINAAIRETHEETGIDLSPTTLALRDEFDYSFQGKGDNSMQYRTVHLLHVKLDSTPEVQIGQMVDKDGKVVDNHDAYAWVSPVHLWNMKNYYQILSGNTQHFSQILGLPD